MEKGDQKVEANNFEVGTVLLERGEYPERIGEPTCQFYLRTGTCKYGASCKFHHPRNLGGSLSNVSLNVCGYPLHPEERECSYYLKTGQCKFGITCKFHHPDPADVSAPATARPFYPTVLYLPAPPEEYISASTSSRVARPQLLPGSYIPGTYGPVLLHPGVVTIQNWNTYSAPVSPALSPSALPSAGMASIYEMSQLSSSTAAFAAPYSPLHSAAGPSSSAFMESLFPERPGQPVCQYYMKTGDCKFGSSCKFHHPADWIASKTNCAYSSLGLPLRPGPFSALCESVANVLDIIKRLKNEENQIAVEMGLQIDKLKFVLAFICTYIQLSYSDLEQFEDRMTNARQKVENLLQAILRDVDKKCGCKYNMHHVLPSLLDNIDDCINSCYRSKSCATMTDKQLNFLLLNLHHLSKYLAEKIFPLVTEYDILQKVCANIRDFHGLIVNGCIKDEIAENVLPQFQLMAERVGFVLWNVLTHGGSQISEQDEDSQIDGDSQISEQEEDNQTEGDSQLIQLAHLFLKIVPIQLEVLHLCYTDLKASTAAEVGCFIKQLVETSPDILTEYLIHLQEHMINVITPSTSGTRNIHVTIEFLLLILTDILKDFIRRDKLFDLLAHVGALTKEVSVLAHGLEEKSRHKESSDETNLATLDLLLENIELLKEDLKNVYLKAADQSQCSFPMTDGPLFIHLLLMHLNDLLDSNAYSVDFIKKEIRQIKEDLTFIRSSLIDVGQELYKGLWKRMLDIAYEAKDVVDSIIIRDNGLLHLIFSLPVILQKIKVVKEDVSNLAVKTPESTKLITIKSPKKPVVSKSMEAGKVIVGFEEETNLIIRNLTNGPKDLDVISITGMPGSGKTTLAYKVYNDKSVSSHFDLRAWCTVDQEYDEKSLLVKLFNQVSTSYLAFSEETDVADMLRKQLFGKRYLIVLDDVWDTTSWDELTRPFPLVEKGSRIILTTREMEVALHGKRNTDPLKLRLLRPEESWELLEKRAFGKESCPNELLDVGKEITKSCKGLPLVVDLIAGVIAKKEKKKTVWLEVRNNLNSFVFNSEVDVMKVIKLSYDHLSDHLKPLFLYLASFGKDTEIQISTVKDYWSAEGLVEQTDKKSVEEVMEVYLGNLISSSLVISLNEIGHAPTCQLHDLVRDFCLIKVREENFFDLISSSAPSSSSSDLMPRTVNVKYDKEHSGIDNFVLFGSRKKRQSGKHLYSLFIYGDKLEDHLSDICHLRHLRLLRVLNLGKSFIKVNDSLLNEICMLNHLRFLYIGTKVKSLPSSFSNLWNLETLIVRNKGSTLVLLPRIWDLVKLRVLSVVYSSFFDVDIDEPILITKDSKLENLKILQHPVLSHSKGTEDIFKRFSNLQVLACDLKESWDYSTERYWFPKLDFLTELEFLKVCFKSSNTNDSGPTIATNQPWDFHFPSNLKKLLLYDFPLTSDSLSTIGRLPNLERLSLIRAIIQGGEWNMGEEDTFEKLKYLHLRDVNLAKWEVGEDCFPLLEKLELESCHKLEQIPSIFGDVCSLKIIKLVESPHLEDSAKNIKQYVEDNLGVELQILGPNNLPLFKHHV